MLASSSLLGEVETAATHFLVEEVKTASDDDENPFSCALHGSFDNLRGNGAINPDGAEKVVVGVGFEPTNARSGRIYSPHPLATWIPYLTLVNIWVESVL